MTVLKRKYTPLPYFLMELKIQVSVGGKKVLFKVKGKKEKSCFLKSRKINRLGPHVQALWECDLWCCWGSQRHLKESSRARLRLGISGSDTVSPSPEDQPAGHSGQGCPGDEKLRRVREKSKGNAERTAQPLWETIPGPARALGAGAGRRDAYRSKLGDGDTLQAGRSCDINEGPYACCPLRGQGHAG